MCSPGESEQIPPMRRQLDLFICAVQFLTRLPTPKTSHHPPDAIERAARYYPLAGQIVGLLSAMVLLAAARVWSGWTPALLAISAGVMVTGAFHEDGLADTADGLGGGQDAPSRLAIMKDSRVGVFGVLALGLVLALKAATLASLAPLAAAAAIFAAHGLGRAASVVGMRALPYAGDPATAKWRRSGQGVRVWEIALALAFAAWPLLLMSPLAAGLGLVVGAAFACAPALAARRLIGGQTGDVLGAIEQLFELGFILGAAAAR
jgi:adenosylcobinamide-GDP ribazoletransferase